MYTFTAEALVLSIHSAIRLSSQLRRAYANTLKTKSIVLPLPAFDGSPKLSTAHKFFRREGKEFLAELKHLATLHQKVADLPEDDISEDDRKDYLDYYMAYWQIVNGQWQGLTTNDLSGMLLIRQWETGKEPITSPLQLVAGTLVEIGIDFFVQTPGAIHPNSVGGKFLQSFLSGIDDVDFATGDDLKATVLRKIIPQMFVSSAETLHRLSDEITGDPKMQNYIRAASHGLVEDIQARIANSNTGDNQQIITDWGALVFKSMVRNSSSYLFAQPNESVGAGIKETVLIASVGQALMDILFDDADPNGISFKEVLTIQSLDKLMQSALTVVAQYPTLLTEKSGLTQIVAGVAATLAESGINRPDLLPEILRLTLAQTAGNLSLLLQTDTGQPKHLLVTALSPILSTFANQIGNGKVHLPNAILLNIVEEVFDEIVQHPQWVQSKVNGNSLLSEVLNAAYSGLSAIPANERLNGDTLQFLIEMSLRTAAQNPAVLSKIKWGSGTDETAILNKALNLVFTFVYQQDQVLNKEMLLLDLIDYILNMLIARHPNKNGLTLTMIILSDQIGVVSRDGVFDKLAADQLVDTALAAIAQHPELVSDQIGIQTIIKDIAATLEASSIELGDMLPEFVRLTLEKTAGNLDLLIDSRLRKQQFILILALQQTLKAISRPAASGKWKPTLTHPQIKEITTLVFDNILQNPHLVKNNFVLTLIRAVFKSLEAVPKSKPIPYIILKSILNDAIAVVNIRKEFLVEIVNTPTGKQKIALEYALDGLMITLYDESDGKKGMWTLTQGPVLEAITEAFLWGLTGRSIDQASIDQSIQEVRNAVQVLNSNGMFILHELLTQLSEGWEELT